MAKQKLFQYILVFVIMTAIAVGGILLFNNLSMHEGLQENVVIKEEGVTSELLKFESLHMIPGESVEYSVNLQTSLYSDFIITLDFVNTTSGGLEKYVMVETDINGDARTFSMVSLFEGVNIVYDAELFENNELKFRFYIPDTVGNEAQKKFVKFDVKLVVTKADSEN